MDQVASRLNDSDLALAYYYYYKSDDNASRLLQVSKVEYSKAKNAEIINLYESVTANEDGLFNHARTAWREREYELVKIIGRDGFMKVTKSADIIEQRCPSDIKRITDYKPLGVERKHINKVYSGAVNFPDLNENAKPLGTFDNLAELVKHLGYVPSQNAMNLELEMLEDGKPISSSFEAKRSFLISECLKAGLPKSAIDDHITALCERNKYHPVQAYLDDGEWDGIERIEPLIEAMNSKDITIAKPVMTKWFVACVAAIYEEFFSCKIVPVLQGGQSFRKTAFISRFANVVPGSFLEGAELNPDNKDSLLSCIKSWIVELGELERTSKNSQGSLKASISKSNDSVRPPYGRADIKKKRQTTFIASVNGTEFLRDETGSTRYAVIELEQPIDMVKVNDLLGWSYSDGRLKLVRPEKLKQFWLEVRVMYEGGASWELTEEELQLISGVNKKHNFKGNWYETLESRFVGVDMKGRHYQWMKSGEVCTYCDIPSNHTRMVGKALKMMADDGLIESETRKARQVFYKIPVVSEK